MKNQKMQCKDSCLKMTIVLASVFLMNSFNLNTKLAINWVTVDKIIQQNPLISYQLCFPERCFHFEPFCLDVHTKSDGIFQKSFILTIPNGMIKPDCGAIFIHNFCIKGLNSEYSEQLMEKSLRLEYLHRNKQNKDKLFFINERVAVLTSTWPSNYYHWMIDILTKLALLEMNHVSYDRILVQTDKPFAKEILLSLLSIDPEKILFFSNRQCFLQAKELIVPTVVGPRPEVLDYLRDRLLFQVQERNFVKPVSKKLFISRADTSRRIKNEHEIFEVLQKYGFEKYELSKLSVQEQIYLFHNAEIIVGEHGAGLTNILFCKPGTVIVEIFQSLKCDCFWNLAHCCHLQYHAVKTIEFTSHLDMNIYRSKPTVSLAAIKEIETLVTFLMKERAVL
ncbi:glycosyltransferase family 61 protein [Candidatus Dependentiae bacterium]|nr:glycosyltransferase family 61 protein [Candidatus Dependentiae bacterium]